MAVYISLLRGINVGGSKIILMDDLKDIFEKLGFEKVKTHIQSGNVVFLGEKKAPQNFERIIKEGIRRSSGLEVDVVVLEFSELKKMIAKNPFDEKKSDGGRIYFTVLMENPPKGRTAELYNLKKTNSESDSSDDFELIGRTVYVLCRDGWSKSPFNSGTTEKILKVNTTSRNLETMKKLAEIASGIL